VGGETSGIDVGGDEGGLGVLIKQGSQKRLMYGGFYHASGGLGFRKHPACSKIQF
jgi:hypothetical protein